jgi:biopolymer transport protein ExbB
MFKIPHRFALLSLVTVLFSWSAFPSPLSAAEGGGGQSGGTLWDMIVESGPVGIGFLVVLGIFSLVLVAIAIERLFHLTRRRLMPVDFLNKLRELTRAETNNPQEFKALAEQHPSSIGRILHAGVLRANRSVAEVEKAMEDAAARENASLRSRLRPLTVIASVAPLVGLLGTVVGMILAFRTTSVAVDNKAELLAEGIYLALLTTAAGLTIAIPAMLLAAYFNGKIDRFLREMDEHLMETIPCFARMESAQPRERKEAAAPKLEAPQPRHKEHPQEYSTAGL